MGNYIVLRRDILDKHRGRLSGVSLEDLMDGSTAIGAAPDEGFLVVSSLDPEYPHIQDAIDALHLVPAAVAVGEGWLVVLPGEDQVRLMRVVEKTAATVQLTDGMRYTRYRTASIEWVELYGKL